MAKIKLLTFILILVSVLFQDIRLVDAATNVSLCPGRVQVSPSPLLNKSDKAEFTIPIGELYDPKVSKWKVRFECGPEALYHDANATFNLNSNSVKTSIDRSWNPFGGCEFFTGIHTLLVIGDDLPRCRGAYSVTDADSQCSLSINPSDGITTSTPVEVSGKDLTKDEKFVLFLDHNKMIEDHVAYVGTRDFSGVKIPKEKLTPTDHILYLRKHNTVSLWGPNDFGPPLCPLRFRVPGGVLSIGGAIVKGPASTAGGQKVKDCNDADPNNPDDPKNKNPAIATAIGCIHTNPTEFVKDLLKFVIGIAGGLAFLMMLLGAFQMLTSAGNPETLNAGRERLTSAIIGLLLVIFAVLLLQIIGWDILKIPGFGK